MTTGWRPPLSDYCPILACVSIDSPEDVETPGMWLDGQGFPPGCTQAIIQAPVMLGEPDADLDALRRWFSHERLVPYLAACGADHERAIRLYGWNAAVAAAFFEELCHFEVILRNAMHEQLAAWHQRRRRPGEWYDDPVRVLDDRRRDDVLVARRRIAGRGALESPGRVVAELSLGFWRFLQRHHQILWAQALHHAFPGMATRRRVDVQRRVNRLHRLRNRIAHHEPIHHEDLAGMHRDLVQVVDWIDSGAADWLTTTCDRLSWLLARRP